MYEPLKGAWQDLLEDAGKFLRQAGFGQHRRTTDPRGVHANRRIGPTRQNHDRDLPRGWVPLDFVDQFPAPAIADELEVGHDGGRTLLPDLTQSSLRIRCGERTDAGVGESERVHLERIGTIVHEKYGLHDGHVGWLTLPVSRPEIRPDGSGPSRS